MFTLKPFYSDLYYRSQFARGSFTLVTSFLSIIEKLLISFPAFGTSLKDLKLEGGSAGLADVHLFCGLPKINTVARFYLDRLEIDFKAFNQIGEEAAVDITQRAWTIVRNADPEIGLVQHEVTLDMQAEIIGSSGKEFIERIVRLPTAFGEKTTCAVVFNMEGGVGGSDVLWSRVVLDRGLAREGALFCKIICRLDGTAVSLERAGERASQFVRDTLRDLGLDLERSS